MEGNALGLLYQVYNPVSRATSEERAGCSKGCFSFVGGRGGEGIFPRAFLGPNRCRGFYYTRGAISRRWCEWWGRGALRGVGGVNWSYGMDG